MRRILVPFHEQDADVPLDLHFTRHEDKAIEQTRNVVELGAGIENVGQPVKNLRCDALVDTAASHLVLPKAWMDRLGLNRMQELDVETATQDVMRGELCGPSG
ncbi:MAG: hypothetical protein DMG17_20805 [Acidobacteria bacterium]|nr:MAG: hypothetical protein DMG17_20805 [Acidobacteriota bacterium]